MTSQPFRTQVPNIIDDLGLDPFERALYVHYRRVCGENPQGYSNETTETIRQKLKMSAGQVSEARKSLAMRGLIRMENTRPVVVTVIDIWNLNQIYYQLEREQRPDVDGWTVEQLNNWLSDIHKVNVSSHNDSNIVTRSETNLTEDEQSSGIIHTVKQNGNMSSYIHKMKQRKESINTDSINKERESHAREVPPGPLSLAFAELCLIDPETLSNGRRKSFFDSLKLLIKIKATVEQVEGFGEWWKNNWRGKNGSPPTPNQVPDFWKEYQASYQPQKKRMVIT